MRIPIHSSLTAIAQSHNLPTPQNLTISPSRTGIRLKIGPNIWAVLWHKIGDLSLLSSSNKFLTPGHHRLHAPFSTLWDGYISNLVPHAPWKLEAYVRIPRFAYEFSKVFEQLCEDLAPKPVVSVAKRQCVCKEDEILEDVWKLFDTSDSSGGRPSQQLGKHFIILPSRCGTTLGTQVQVIAGQNQQLDDAQEQKGGQGTKKRTWLRRKFRSEGAKGWRLG